MRYKVVALKIEIEKLFRSKFNYILLSMGAVSILYYLRRVVVLAKYGLFQQYDYLSFITSGYLVMNAIVIFNIYIVFMASRCLSREMSGGNIKMYLTRIGNRRTIYKAKSASLCLYYTSIMVAYVIVMSAIYVILSKLGYVYPITTLYNIQSRKVIFYFFIMIYLSRLLLIKLSLFLSTYFIEVITVFLYVIAYCIIDVTNYTRLVQYMTPTYYIEMFIKYSYGTDTIFLVFVCCFILLSIFIDNLGIKHFERKDI